MKLNKPILLALLAINPITQALYAEDAPAGDKVAKVIIIKGQAKAKLLNAQVLDLKKDDWLPEGAIIQTTDKSFVKLVFVDKSTVSVGPQSKMVISSFPKEGAGVLSVIKGQIRSQVVKELDSNGEAKTKLFVKTKSAAMGVRGTDFQVMFNPENNVTSLVTFEGNVAFAKMDPATSSTIPTINQPAAAAASGASASAPATTNVALESVISSDKAVHVTAGQFSGANPGAVMATIPTKISPAQFETMKGNASLGAEAPAAPKVDAPAAPKYVSVVAPGLPPAMTANTESSITKVVATNLGGEDNLKKAVAVVTGDTKKADAPTTGEAKRDVASTGKEAPKDAAAGPKTAPVAANTNTKNSSPEGFVNKSTGEYQPPAGGYVDFGTGLYIPPPPGSTFDANTGVYVPPPQFGGFNPATGNYAPPTGLVLTANGEFVAAPKERAPASDGKPAAGAATDAGKPAPRAATTAALVPPPINASGDLSKVYNPTSFTTYVASAPNSANQFGMPPIYAGANGPGAPGTTPGGYVPPAYDSERLDNLRNNVYNQINQQNQIIQSTRIKINIIVQ